MRRRWAVALPLLLSLALCSPVTAASAAAASGSISVHYLSSAAEVVSGLAPGDMTQWAADVTNAGSTSSVLSIALSTDGQPLTSDQEDGLHVTASTCSQPLHATDAAAMQRFICPGTTRHLGSGPVTTVQLDSDPNPLLVGGLRGVLLDFSFPHSAGNAFEGTSGAVMVTLHLTGQPTPPTPLDGLAFTGANILGGVAVSIVTFTTGWVLIFVSRRQRARRTMTWNETAL